MGLLDDFLQSASNSAASNVSAPVDGLAWLLRKIGAPIPSNPVGGSDWMQQQGLTRPVQQSGASLAGDAFGMIAPMVAAAKAPQIAKGLLSLDDKAMDMAKSAVEKRMVNGGMIQPATVWHGSPHKFDKFDSSKIGTGEGAQAYGHGLYLAESPDVARAYQSSLSDFGLPDGNDVMGVAKLISAQGAKGEARVRKGYGALKAGTPELEQAISQAKQAIDSSSSLYKVDLPDEHIAKMLDWDKPLSQQPQGVRSFFEPHIQPLRKPMAQGDEAWGELGKPVNADDHFTGAELISMLRGQSSGSEMEKMMSMGGPEVANKLRAAGIPGVRYLDGGSRSGGAGTSNFVVFPGNEGLLSILERNGQPLK